MSKRVKRIFVAILIIISTSVLGFIISQFNPYTALRAELLSMGYIKSAFTAKIVEINNEGSNDNIKFYYFDKRPLDRFGAQIGNFKVTKKGLLYLVDYMERG